MSKKQKAMKYLKNMVNEYDNIREIKETLYFANKDKLKEANKYLGGPLIPIVGGFLGILVGINVTENVLSVYRIPMFIVGAFVGYLITYSYVKFLDNSNKKVIREWVSQHREESNKYFKSINNSRHKIEYNNIIPKEIKSRRAADEIMFYMKSEYVEDIEHAIDVFHSRKKERSMLRPDKIERIINDNLLKEYL